MDEHIKITKLSVPSISTSLIKFWPLIELPNTFIQLQDFCLIGGGTLGGS